MPGLQEAVQELIATGAKTSDPSNLQPLADAVYEASKSSLGMECEEAVALLSARLSVNRPLSSGWFAITAGGLVEKGASPVMLIEALLHGLPELCILANAFAGEAWQAALSPEESKNCQGRTDGIWLRDRFLSVEIFQALRAGNKAGSRAAMALELWLKPSISCFSLIAQARARARATLQISPAVEDLLPFAGWLRKLLAVLDDERLLVLHPGCGLGFLLRMSGVSDNFQLHTLLSDLLVGATATRVNSIVGNRPPPEAAAVAWGTGPQQWDKPTHGNWDLCQWKAVQPDGVIPEKVPPQHWIFGEGIPADIPVFEGFRVVILRPQSYVRAWGTGRHFAHLRPTLFIEQILEAEAVAGWLQRFAAGS